MDKSNALKRFVHEFDSNGVSLIDRLDSPEGVRIEVSIDSPDQIWISANQDGWEYLAKLCAEMAGKQLNKGWHVHREFDPVKGNRGPEVTLGLETWIDERIMPS